MILMQETLLLLHLVSLQAHVVFLLLFSPIINSSFLLISVSESLSRFRSIRFDSLITFISGSSITLLSSFTSVPTAFSLYLSYLSTSSSILTSTSFPDILYLFLYHPLWLFFSSSIIFILFNFIISFQFITFPHSMPGCFRFPGNLGWKVLTFKLSEMFLKSV